MFLKKFYSSTILFILVPLFLIGCSNLDTTNEKTVSTTEFYAVEEPFLQSASVSKSDPSLMSSSLSVSPQSTPRMPKYDSAEIFTGSITLEVNSVEGILFQIQNLVERNEGFVEYLNSYGTDYNQNANLTIRVPQKKFNGTMFQIETLGIVLNKSTGSEDVSEQLIDLEARLKSYTREETNLYNLLDKSKTIADIIAIERELSRIRSEIESLEGRLKYYDSKITMSTININLVTAYANNTSPPYGDIKLTTSDIEFSLNKIKNLIASDDGRIDYISSNYLNNTETIELLVIIKRGSFSTIFKSLEDIGSVNSKYSNEPQNPNLKIEAKIDARITITLREPNYLSENSKMASVTILILVLSGFVLWLVTRKR
jgi:hypothetical protein